MRRRIAASCGAVAAALVLSVCNAEAQRPICPSTDPGAPTLTTCRLFSLLPVIRWLDDFTVDHLWKPFPPAFTRDVQGLLQLVAGGTLRGNEELDEFIGDLASLQFSQLDRTTGAVLAPFGDAPRKFEAVLDQEPGRPTLRVRLPARLEGGYWRGPDVVQLGFWEHHRASATLQWEDGRTLGGEITCLSLSPDGLLLRFASDKASPVMVLFRECPS